jgi:carbonic anhydrase
MAIPEKTSQQEAMEWGYEVANGPDQWCCLKNEYSACGHGHAQSPIDLTGAAMTTLKPIQFNYQAVPLAIFNNGHTIQVRYAPGSCICYNEKTYDLLQFHFHQPSEHTIDGEPCAMELHLVHRHAGSGNMAVIAVMIVEGDETNTAYCPIFDHLPTEVGEPDAEPAGTINARDLLPDDSRHFFTYEGSLTTPPCSEIVRWLVLAEPVRLSREQLATFGAIYDHNARPVQPLNNRDLFTNAG